MRYPSKKNGLRQILVWAGLIVCLIVLSQQAPRLVTQQQLSVDDYVEYWSSARLALHGGNPYDAASLEALQRQAGRTVNVPVFMWNPPFTLAWVFPLALLDYPMSRLWWLLASAAALFASLSLLWKLYQGPQKLLWIAWLAGITFGPVIQALKTGQIDLFILLGMAGFLYLESQKKDWWAGACAALVLIKPHIVYLLLLWLAIWIITQRRWKVAGGLLLAVTGSLALVLLFDPLLIQQYWQAAQSVPPTTWATATLGGGLRLMANQNLFILQFLPAVLGLAWFAGYLLWRTRMKSNWSWLAVSPALVMASITTSAYGWLYDQVIILAAFIPFYIALPSYLRLRRPILHILALAGLAAYLALNWVILTWTASQVYAWWTAGAFLLIWAWVGIILTRASA